MPNALNKATNVLLRSYYEREDKQTKHDTLTCMTVQLMDFVGE
jgi:hypothetical protein